MVASQCDTILSRSLFLCALVWVFKDNFNVKVFVVLSLTQRALCIATFEIHSLGPN